MVKIHDQICQMLMQKNNDDNSFIVLQKHRIKNGHFQKEKDKLSEEK